MDQNVFTNYDQLPIVLRAEEIAAALGISRGNAYILMHREDFPTLHIGKRPCANTHKRVLKQKDLVAV